MRWRSLAARATEVLGRRADLVGTLTAILFLSLSLTPSLLPRPWLFQGIVSGTAATIGYGLGVLIGHLARRIWPGRVHPTVRVMLWRLAAITAVGLPAAGFVLHVRWQEEVHRLMGISEPVELSWLGSLALAVAVSALLVSIFRLLRAAARTLAGVLRRWLPVGLASVVGTVVALALVAGIVDGVVIAGLFRAADRAFAVINETVEDAAARPTQPERSGSPGSRAAWETLGVQGRRFVAAGPDIADLEAFGGPGAKSPIRVYVGLDSAPDAAAAARLAVDELERTGAFDRGVLAVMLPTGTGWVNATATAALEYLHHGDTAAVAVQYSYLPSWMSHLVDQSRAAETAGELLAAVRARWERIPATARPQLLVYGESLGSFAGESAFGDIRTLHRLVDGALWVGPPNFNPIWRSIVAERHPGTPQRLPVFEGGRTVRFAAGPGDLNPDDATWSRPRVVYLQHPSDPIVWWSPGLLVRRPDWLREPRGADVASTMRWSPIVTFAQVTADILQAGRVPAGHGHRYGTLVIDGWAAVSPAQGWTASDTQRLRQLLTEPGAG